METYPNALLGYRVWRVREGKLVSLGRGSTLWRPGHNVAYCPHLNHHAPEADCECGFNAYHTLEEAHRTFRTVTTDVGEGFVIGAVALRGDTQIHNTGSRAAEARIIALLGKDPVREVAEKYGVPLFTCQEELEEYALTQASPAPKEVLPEFVPQEDKPQISRELSEKEKKRQKERDHVLSVLVGATLLLVSCTLVGARIVLDLWAALLLPVLGVLLVQFFRPYLSWAAVKQRSQAEMRYCSAYEATKLELSDLSDTLLMKTLGVSVVSILVMLLARNPEYWLSLVLLVAAGGIFLTSLKINSYLIIKHFSERWQT